MFTVVQIMGTRSQLRCMIQTRFHYPCLFRFNYYKIVTLIITKCFEGGMHNNCL